MKTPRPGGRPVTSAQVEGVSRTPPVSPIPSSAATTASTRAAAARTAKEERIARMAEAIRAGRTKDIWQI